MKGKKDRQNQGVNKTQCQGDGQRVQGEGKKTVIQVNELEAQRLKEQQAGVKKGDNEVWTVEQRRVTLKSAKSSDGC